MPFVHRHRVRYHECDPQGIVFNANWLTYFDVTLTEWFREAFGSYDALTVKLTFRVTVLSASLSVTLISSRYSPSGNEVNGTA